MFQRYACLIGFLGVYACSTDAYPTSPNVDSESARIGHLEYRLSGLERQIWLFVVDDAPTETARTLREQVAAAIALPEGGPFVGESLCPGDDYDPSREDRIDIRVIVAHASDDSENRLVTPAENAALARLGERDDPLAHDAWREAIKEELLRSKETVTTGRYRPLETIASTIALFASQRAPNSDKEKEQLQALAPTPQVFVRVFLATNRDDDSPSDVTAYGISGISGNKILDSEPQFSTEVRLLVSGRADDDESGLAYLPDYADYPRISAFQKQANESSILVNANEPKNLFDPTLSVDYGQVPCFTKPPVRRRDGSVDCRIHLLSTDLSNCDERLGRRDPLTGSGNERKPRFELTFDGVNQRVCEVMQLSGEPLERCLEDSEANQSTAGFCYPKPTRACVESQCSTDNGSPLSFRFAGNSLHNDARQVFLRFDCSLEIGLPQQP
jgi:hypothetical protein